MEDFNVIQRERVTAAITPSVLPASILVVDDDAAVRETLRLLLTRAGLKASTATTGSDAFDKINAAMPQVLLCDLDLAGICELLQIVRRYFPGVAVIAMSGSFPADASPEGVLADACYRKGQSGPPELLRLINYVLQRSCERVFSRDIVASRRHSAGAW
jgi:DNA-binding NtrC family response regulator